MRRVFADCLPLVTLGLVSRRSSRKRVRGDSGQMTIEFIVVFPVLIAIALVAVNATLFLSECAGFDRAFREEVCALAPSPGYGESSGQVAAQVQTALEKGFDRDYLEVSVSAAGQAGGLVTYRASLEFTPTLFGKGNLTGAFGVSFPRMTHEQVLSVDQYKPGVLL